MIEQQATPTDEDKEEQELEEAEKEFAEEMEGEIEDTEEIAEQNQQILAALGFKRYEDPGVIKYAIRVMDIKIGITFNEAHPLGKIWAYKIPEGDEEKEFLKNGDLNQHPLVQKYKSIQEGKEPLPEIIVTGKIIEKRGKAILIQIEENGESKQIFFGQGAVKKDTEGYFIPAGFSNATKEHDAKMAIPRDIRLSDYKTQLEQAPVADTTKKEEEKESKEKAEQGTVADKIPHKEPVPLAEGEKLTVDYYVNLIGEITEKVRADERISEREAGYAINMVFNAITKDTRAALIAELKNGIKEELYDRRGMAKGKRTHPGDAE